MLKMFQDSCIFSLLNKFFNWIKSGFKRSSIIMFFVNCGNIDIDKYIKNSFFYNILVCLFVKFKNFIKLIKFDKVLKNRIFTDNLFWVSLTIASIPFLPTKLVLILCIASILSVFLKSLIDNEFKYKKFIVNYLIVAFIICIIFSSIFSSKNIETLPIMLLNVVFILMYFAMINTIKTKRDLNLVIEIILICGMFVSIYGIYQYIFGKSVSGLVWVDQKMFEDIAGRVTSTFNNPNVLGTYLIFYVTLAFSKFIVEKVKIKKVYYLLCTGLSFFCMILTYSRGCWIALIISLGLLLIIIDKKFVLIGFFAILIGFVILPNNIIERLFSIGNVGDTSTSYRVNIWNSTLIMLKPFFLCGIGFGGINFKYIFQYYAYNSVLAEHPHNVFLVILSGMGIIGLIVFGLILIYLFKKMISNYVKNRNKNDIKQINVLQLSIITGLIGMLVQGMFDNIWYNYSLLLLFFIIMGIGISVGDIMEKGE